MKTEILKLLRETDGYISGQEMCDYFHVSRTAVWKVINQLKEEGYQIEAVRNKGYHLMAVSDILSREELESSNKTEWAGKSVKFYDRVDSTNTKAKELAEKNAPHGTLVVAESQSMGKGRRGRFWESPPGTGIWMSLVLRPEILPSCASMLTLVAALAVCQGIEKECGIKAQIKWPNDIVVNGKKVCGILTEMNTDLDDINYVVTGMGINVNVTEFPQEISQVATSLWMETGKKVLRSPLICSIMQSIEDYYNCFTSVCDMSLLMDEYNDKLANRNRFVKVLGGGQDYSGIALGINEAGELLVETDKGDIKKVVSGEVSVRGIYGYV